MTPAAEWALGNRQARYEASQAAVAELIRGALLWSACECDDGTHAYPDITESVFTSTAAYTDVRSAENAGRAAHIVHRITENAAWKATS